MLRAVALALLVAAPLAGTAAADPVDNFGANAMIHAGLYQKAAHRLEARVAAMPSDETAFLNLAYTYRKLGREADAQAAFRRVLALDDVMLDTDGGAAISSHALARRGLARLATLSSAR